MPGARARVAGGPARAPSERSPRPSVAMSAGAAPGWPPRTLRTRFRDLKPNSRIHATIADATGICPVLIEKPCVFGGSDPLSNYHFAPRRWRGVGLRRSRWTPTSLVTTRLITDGPALTRGPHFEGPVRVLDIPSRRFYATTEVPAEGGRGDSARHALSRSERVELPVCATSPRTSRWRRGNDAARDDRVHHR